MQEQQDNMSLIKKLTRINKEGSSMSAEERAWFEEKNKKSYELSQIVKVCTETNKL